MRKNVKTAVILQGMTALIAVVVLILTVAPIASRGDRNAKAIEIAAYRSCVLIRGILTSFHTPEGAANARLIMLENPELRDCHKYSTSPPGE